MSDLIYKIEIIFMTWHKITTISVTGNIASR